MKITLPQQAPCSDRTRLTIGPDPSKWIVGALPSDWMIHSFHFFVNWKHSPSVLGNELWMTRLLHFISGENPEKVTEDEVLKTFQAAPEQMAFESLTRFCRQYEQDARVLLLPEIPTSIISDNTPIWAISQLKDNSFEANKFLLSELKNKIRLNSGGPVWVGSKGLTYGTSSVECMLSQTDSAYPGDADAVICDETGKVRCVVEYKKHTLDDAIGNHLISKYYPTPDGRKYIRLGHLVARYRTNGKVPFVVLYYSTRRQLIRLQTIGGFTKSSVQIEKDSDDIDLSTMSQAEVNSQVSGFLAIFP